MWDGKHLAEWAGEIEGADVVVNLAGRSAGTTRLVGQAIAAAAKIYADAARGVGRPVWPACRQLLRHQLDVRSWSCPTADGNRLDSEKPPSDSGYGCAMPSG